MLLVSYIQQYFNTSITVLTNQVWKLLIALLKAPNTLLKSAVTCRDHMVHCHGSHECWFTHRQFHSQFHSRRHSLRITLKYTTLMHMRSSNAWTMKSWQRSEWHFGFISIYRCVYGSIFHIHLRVNCWNKKLETSLFKQAACKLCKEWNLHPSLKAFTTAAAAGSIFHIHVMETMDGNWHICTLLASFMKTIHGIIFTFLQFCEIQVLSYSNYR